MFNDKQEERKQCVILVPVEIRDFVKANDAERENEGLRQLGIQKAMQAIVDVLTDEWRAIILSRSDELEPILTRAREKKSK